MLTTFQRRAAATALAVLAGAIGAPARAQVEPIRLTYRSGPGCPDEAEFVDALRARSDWAQRDRGGDLARAFDVAVSAEAGQGLGVLRITKPDGSVGERTVRGETCSEVVSALALIAALAIDPPPETEETSGTGILREATVKSDRAVMAPAAPWPASQERRMRWGTGVEGQAITGFVPSSGLGGGAFVDLAGAHPGTFVPSFRASVFAASANPSLSPAVRAKIVWAFARIEVCPVHVPVQGSFVLAFCAVMDAGALHSEGAGLANVATDNRPWLAPGALGRVEWAFPSGAWVEGSGALSVPLERYVFSYHRAGAVGDSAVSQIPLWGAGFTLGVGVHFL